MQDVIVGDTSPLELKPRATPPPEGPLSGKSVFLLGLILAATGLISPPIALLGGIVYGFSFAHPFRREASSLAKLLLKISVVMLGFGMNLRQVIHAGRSGFLYTAIGIAVAITLGLLLGKLFRVSGKSSFLITVGTAICGGSAIAAVAPVLQASEEEISVSMGTVFLLNSVALFLFPSLGWLLHLSQNQFGLWAALAIHDTSSVVGASAKYGPQALAIGTSVKLARALWIVPVALVTPAIIARSQANTQTTPQAGSKANVQIPYFIFLFVLASVISTYIPRYAADYATFNQLGKTGLTATLFLIGTSLSKKTIQQVGLKPFLQGVVLWLIVGSVSLAAIYSGLIGI